MIYEGFLYVPDVFERRISEEWTSYVSLPEGKWGSVFLEPQISIQSRQVAFWSNNYGSSPTSRDEISSILRVLAKYQQGHPSIPSWWFIDFLKIPQADWVFMI